MKRGILWLLVTFTFALVLIGCNKDVIVDVKNISKEERNIKGDKKADIEEIKGNVEESKGDLEEDDRSGIKGNDNNDSIENDKEINIGQIIEAEIEKLKEAKIEKLKEAESNTIKSDIKNEKNKNNITKLVYSEDFEGANSEFYARGKEQVEITKEDAYEGDACLKSYNRSETWQGASINLSKIMTEQKKFKIKAWIKYKGGATSNRIYVKVEQNGTNYLNFGSVMAKRDEWTLLEGTVQIPIGTKIANIYFETEYNTSATEKDLVDIFIDNIELYEMIVDVNYENLPSLYKIHSDYFLVGVAVSAFELQDKVRGALITSQFNSMTMGNEMKPESILDYNTSKSNMEKHRKEPALNFSKLDIGMQFAKESGITMRGHTLVWHSQTPRWFFTENYSMEPNAKLASKEIMIARMESYIKQVITYCQTNYPGIIYAWDVVNEAIEVSDNEKSGYRSKDSYWYQIIGPEYVELAFSFARKYADSNVKLFYNDYNCEEKNKLFAIYDVAEELVYKGILDGIGLQSHLNIDSPTLIDYEYAITKFAKLGVEIHITELDVNIDSSSEEDLKKLGMKYKRLFTLYQHLVKQKKANITSVTIWGLSDENSWLNSDKRKYPLLFDDFLQAKDAYWGACLDESISF